ncbi:MAG: CBS domain-containing protein [Thermodesulfobacteriota bacterium]
MIAANIMNTEVVTLGPEATLGEGIKLLTEKGISKLPIVDGERRVLGLITPRILMKAVLPKYITSGFLKDVKFAPEPKEFIEKFEGLTAKKLSEFLDMGADGVCSISPETSTMEIAAICVNAEKPVECIMVVDDEKRLLGIISPWDFLKRLWEYVEKKNG